MSMNSDYSQMISWMIPPIISGHVLCTSNIFLNQIYFTDIQLWVFKVKNIRFIIVHGFDEEHIAPHTVTDNLKNIIFRCNFIHETIYIFFEMYSIFS